MATTTVECPTCNGGGIVAAWRRGPDAVDDHEECRDCRGSGEVPLTTPPSIARRENAPPHGCTGAACATCGDDTPALVAWGVARLLRAASLRCAARVALAATTREEWGDVATDAAEGVLRAPSSEYARHAYRAAAAMRVGDVACAAQTLAHATGHTTVEAWRTHARWVIADERRST